MNDPRHWAMENNRRIFLKRSGMGLGSIALSALAGAEPSARAAAESAGGLPGLPHFAAKAKRVIYLFQSGAPSQFESFDYKPKLDELHESE
ncbi:MAG: DUF1501 domain-containing protein, partial [Planctomycetales bacterium]|nr:DUF1501 domain-containing protein [Planctomycetales bacterium]